MSITSTVCLNRRQCQNSKYLKLEFSPMASPLHISWECVQDNCKKKKDQTWRLSSLSGASCPSFNSSCFGPIPDAIFPIQDILLLILQSQPPLSLGLE